MLSKRNGTILLSTLLVHFPMIVECWTLTTRHKRLPRFIPLLMSTVDELSSSDDEVELDSLIDMDVVIYSNKDDEKETKMFAALQEDGTLSPLSAWTTEPAFGESVEFLVDEEDRFSLDKENVKLHYLLNEAELSYGSRQCHRGVGNPHGEESELLYYVEQPVIEKFQIQLNLKPDLEILW